MSLQITAEFTANGVDGKDTKIVVVSDGATPRILLKIGPTTYVVNRKEIFDAVVAVCGEIVDGTGN